MVDPLRYFSFHPVIHNRCNKGRGMCYPLGVMVHIKEPLLLYGKSSLCSGGSLFPLSLSEWSFYHISDATNRIINVLSASLNKAYTFLSTANTKWENTTPVTFLMTDSDVSV